MESQGNVTKPNAPTSTVQPAPSMLGPVQPTGDFMKKLIISVALAVAALAAPALSMAQSRRVVVVHHPVHHRPVHHHYYHHRVVHHRPYHRPPPRHHYPAHRPIHHR